MVMTNNGDVFDYNEYCDFVKSGGYCSDSEKMEFAKLKERRVFMVYWKNKFQPESVIRVGFLKAEDIEEAWQLVKSMLNEAESVIVDITEASEHMVTPQSITLNFENTSQYHFG